MSFRPAQMIASFILVFLVGILSFSILFSPDPIHIVFAQTAPPPDGGGGGSDNPSCNNCCNKCEEQSPNDTPDYNVPADFKFGEDTPPGTYHLEGDGNVGWGVCTGNCNEGGGGTPGGGGGTPAPAPTCTIDLVPASSTVSLGSSTPLVASFLSSSGTIDEVHFVSSQPDIAGPNSTTDPSSPYSVTSDGRSIGSATITATVHMTTTGHDHEEACSDTATVQVTNPPGWWQTKDADVWSRGDLTSSIPATCTGACVNKFSLDGTGGFPGVIVYNGAANFGSKSVSSKGWLANSGYAGTAYNYAWFENKIPSGVEVNTIPDGSINGGYLASNGNPSGGYVWFKRTGDLTINSQANVGNRKVILFVTGSLNINGRVNFNKGSGFFMTIVGGNINIDPGVSHPSQPALEGAYFAGGNISTGTGGTSSDNQLYIRGSIVANGSINLQRDLGSGNQITPAEFIEFAPDLIFTYPTGLGAQSFIWHEVAP